MARPPLPNSTIREIALARQTMTIEDASKFLGVSSRTIKKYTGAVVDESCAVTLAAPSPLPQQPNAPGVEYREVVGFPGYLVGDDGSLWSRRFAPRIIRGVAYEWRKMKPATSKKSGHMMVSLNRAGEKARRTGVHRLVLLAFVGACPDGMEGCHWDGNPANNRLDNLRWDTPLANGADRRRHTRALFRANIEIERMAAEIGELKRRLNELQMQGSANGQQHAQAG